LFFKIYENELYEWSFEKPSNITQIETEVPLGISAQTSKILFIDKGITVQPQQQKHTLKLDDVSANSTFLMTSDIGASLIPIVILIPIMIFLIQIFSKLVKVSSDLPIQLTPKNFSRIQE